jgi:hypothetical protein
VNRFAPTLPISDSGRGGVNYLRPDIRLCARFLHRFPLSKRPPHRLRKRVKSNCEFDNKKNKSVRAQIARLGDIDDLNPEEKTKVMNQRSYSKLVLPNVSTLCKTLFVDFRIQITLDTRLPGSKAKNRIAFGVWPRTAPSRTNLLLLQKGTARRLYSLKDLIVTPTPRGPHRPLHAGCIRLVVE